MQLFCQSCQAAFAATSHCPRCGSRLLSPQESFIHAGKAKKPPPDPIPPTFGNRLTIGVLTALGLALGLRELAGAFNVLSGRSVSEFWADANTDPTTFTLRLFAVAFGGLLAGAGRSGMQVGAATGLIVGAGLTTVDLYAAGKVNDLIAILLAAAYPLAGTLAGAIGAWLWPSDVVLPEPVRLSSHGSSMAKLASEDAERRRHRPTAWLRILAGSVVIVVISMNTDFIRWALAKYSANWLNTANPKQGPVIGLEIATMATMLGGLIAGAGTGAGLKHGLLAAILAGAGLIFGAQNRPTGSFPAVEGFLNLFGAPLEPLSTPSVAVQILIALLFLAGIAGWFGGQLYPPLAHKKFWKRSLQRQS